MRILKISGANCLNKIVNKFLNIAWKARGSFPCDLLRSNMITTEEFEKKVESLATVMFGRKIEDCNHNQLYKIIASAVKDILTEKRLTFKKACAEQNAKNVYYMSMEFLLGKSLKNHLFNLGISDIVEKTCQKYGCSVDELCEIEPDAGLGNGGLGRLAAAYMESLTNLSYPASGFSIKYEFGIFKQKMADGWQMELPDEWLKDGAVWLAPREEDTFPVTFGGEVVQHWNDNRMVVEIKNADTILAVPYDMNVSGYHTDAVNTLRLWDAKASMDFDMQAFSRGDYIKALYNKSLAESISKVLYPADDHIEGKSLRLKQQYFFVSASIQSIIKKHLADYGTLDNFADKVSIHINDTHPTLCIPELMRILLDVYGYSWDDAWKIVCGTMSYTNHTVMAEALEKWPESLFAMLLPRVHQIVQEINKRFCADLWDFYPNDWNRVANNAILQNGQVRMANLCLAASHTINGVSALHSDLLKQDVFHDYYNMQPKKFTNVTNGITYRRWLALSNPKLTAYICSLIGDDFLKDCNKLADLIKFKGDKKVLGEFAKIKRENKERLAKYIKENNGIDVNVDSIFDVQVKRLHEYKRQLLNCMHIIDLYLRLKENPDLDIHPRTFIFGAKAAPSYYTAKSIIRLICMLGEQINNDPDIKGKIKVVFLENYRVSLAEIVMPASDVSEQISIAGKEASGTGNMKFMINGAVTMGTMDGANVEIHENVGDENIFIFGLREEEVSKMYKEGYYPSRYYNENYRIKRVIDMLNEGIAGVKFNEIAHILTTKDPYMCLADFQSYVDAQDALDKAYGDVERWNRMSLVNVAKSGFFSSDRSIQEYADRIWALSPVKVKKAKAAKAATKTVAEVSQPATEKPKATTTKKAPAKKSK